MDLREKNGFTLKKEKKARSRLYAVQTTTDADYADDIALLSNTPTPAKSQQVPGGIGLHVNIDKTEYI